MFVKTKTRKNTMTRGKSEGAASPRGRMPGPRDEELQTVFNEVSAAPRTSRIERWLQVACPYCSEEFEVHLTSEEDGQSLYEDCQVCCRPIVLYVSNEEGELQVDAHRS